MAVSIIDSQTTMEENLIKEARQIVASALRKAADLHDAGKFDDIDTSYDNILIETSPLTDGKDKQCNIAFIFWDSWGDSSRHAWRYYKGIGKQDWPRLARVIASNLESGTDINTNALSHVTKSPNFML